jgi:peptidoglycan/xylan/chitin deacetylase (PgdA/CDA1 family)
VPHVSPIVLYHGVYADVPRSLRQGLHNVRPNQFEKQIRWLKEHFHIVSIDEWFECKNRKQKACITFDDAYDCVFIQALPILIRLKVPSTVFINGYTFEGGIFWRDKVRYIINNGLIPAFVAYLRSVCGNDYGLTSHNFYRHSKSPNVNSRHFDRYMSEFLEKTNISETSRRLGFLISKPEQLLNDSLVTYGNHTYSHYVLSSLSVDEQTEEIAANEDLLNSLNVRRSRVFSIPFGEAKDMGRETLRLLKHYGFLGGLYSRKRLNFGEKGRNRYLRGVPLAERFMAPIASSNFTKSFLRMILLEPVLRMADALGR